MAKKSAQGTDRISAQMKAAKQGFAAGFTKMTLQPCTKDGAAKGGEIKVIVNPESYQRSFTASTSGGDKKNTNQRLAGGKLRPSKVVQFSQSLSFELWYDSTGVFPDCVNVATEITKLREGMIDYRGDIHSTAYVRITWGDLNFNGQLQSISIDYLHFNRHGQPLRAKANLSFTEILDGDLQSRKENDQSPDLTHVRIVKDGDNLPLLCNEIYDSPLYYPQVAAANGLAHFTDLRPGQRLFFPPLR